MSSKEITITAAEGSMLGLVAVRQIHYKSQFKPGSFLIVGKTRTKKVSVQYGLGVAGEGATLREAVADFRRNWTFFCDHRQAIVRGEMKGWN